MKKMFTIDSNQELTASILLGFINKHEKKLVPRFKRLESYYEDKPDRDREAPNEILAAHNYAKYIVSVNNGYLLGSPLKYQFKEDVDGTKIIENYNDQSINDLDSELADSCSIFGRAYEYIFADENSKPKSTEIEVYNAFIIYDTTVMHNKLYGVIYSPILNNKGEPEKDTYSVTIVSKDNIVNAKLKDKAYSNKKETKHYFGYVPLIEYSNNKRQTGDYESVLKLIDSYDILQSDRILDREKLVDAILAISGADMTDEQKTALKNSRTVALPEGSKMEYIIKNINEADADVLRGILSKDIHKFSFTPDLSDENFANNTSGVAILYKLVVFFWNITKKSRYLEKSFKERAVIYSKYLNIKSQGSEISGNDLEIIFKGELPKNDLEMSQIINNLDGKIDSETLISQMSFVRDAAEVVKKAREEQEQLYDNYKNDSEIPDSNEE